MPGGAPRPARSPRAEPREIVELKRLKTEQPELASAADMHIALVELQRRVQSRLPFPRLDAPIESRLRPGELDEAVLHFENLPFDWTEFRLMFRQTADILRRFDILDASDHDRLQALAREAHALEPIVLAWFEAVAHPSTNGTARREAPTVEGSTRPMREAPPAAVVDQVIGMAMRPFLARSAEVLLPRLDLSRWTAPTCPLCGGEPEFAAITAAGDRLLVCGRCTGHWPYDPTTCPFCKNDDRRRITSFTSRDGQYRLYACEACRRYLKAYDGRRAPRPVMLSVDTVATLPLDAAAIQKGYRG